MVLTSVVCCVIGNNDYECVSGSGHSVSVASITEAVTKLSNITVVSTERENNL